MANVLEQIRKLDEQKAQLLESAKQEALGQADQAIATLNELGFSYRLVEGDSPAPRPTRTRTPPEGGSTRRTGIRDDVLRVIKDAPDGIKSGDITDTLGDRKEEPSLPQAVSNALTALKNSGKVVKEGNLYKAT